MEQEWNKPIKKYVATLKSWSKVNLSLTAKISVLKNHAISILCYYGTFLPIPPKALQSITKEATKFIWNYQKSKVNHQTISLLKQLGGLNFPDIPSIFKSLKAKWISRILDSHDNTWKALAKWSVSNMNAIWGHGLSAVFCVGNSHDTKRSLSQFWSQAMDAFWELKPELDTISNNPAGANIVRSLPLFNNPNFNLKADKWKKLTKKGICRLTDITFLNRPGSKEEINEFYGIDLPKQLYDELLRAIPQEYWKIIEENPWTIHPNTVWGFIDEEGQLNKVTPDDLFEKNQLVRIEKNGKTQWKSLSYPLLIQLRPMELIKGSDLHGHGGNPIKDTGSR